MIYTAIYGLIGAYLIGSLSFSYIIGKKFYKKDIRQYGSGNAGATNMARVLGKKAGIVVLILDILKGTLALSLSFCATFSWYPFALASVCLLGHIYPIFFNFRGGKGVATTLGILLAVNWELFLVALISFVIIFAVFKIVSISSMAASLVVVIWSSIFYTKNIVLLYFLVALLVFIIFTHKENIKRLLKKEEKKFKIAKNN